MVDSTLQIDPEARLRERMAQLVAAAGGQRAFARQIGVSQSAISRYIAGHTSMTPRLARALVSQYRGLKTDIDAVFFGQNMHEIHALRA